LTPTPIVLDTETFFRKIPFVAEGFDLFNASSRSVHKFGSSFSWMTMAAVACGTNTEHKPSSTPASLTICVTRLVRSTIS
jgi:hypothetical protein